jgi:hypothetical protein
VTQVVLASGVDGHNSVVRHASEIIDREGRRVLDGLDVAQLTADGQLRRILVFHGSLPAVGQT